MKTDAIYKRAFNDALDVVSALGEGDELPSENSLRTRLRVSRTTVRKVLAALADCGVVSADLPRRKNAPGKAKVLRFPKDETVPLSLQVERRFMEWMLRDNAAPGTIINELELARKFGMATTLIREFLNRFQRFGLIEKGVKGWLLKGFTQKFALELFEIREMFELRSARLFVSLPESSPTWDQIRLMRDAHIRLLDDIDERFHDFSELDSRFHRLISSVSPNRFIDSFYDIITLIFHYHYQWNKRDERQRNEVAIREHLTYIDALQSRNISLIELACRAHMTSARETLLRSVMH
jgi:DNA-binding GntR family transcriptional regulator